MLGITVPGLAETTQAGLDALETMGLSRLRNRFYVHLSGGECQRVHIARALAQVAMPRLDPARRDACCWTSRPPTSMWHTMVRVARPSFRLA